jgi:hypothetical protein
LLRTFVGCGRPAAEAIEGLAAEKTSALTAKEATSLRSLNIDRKPFFADPD